MPYLHAIRDCAWHGGNPDDDINSAGGWVPNIPDYNKISPMNWWRDMARFCMDRHNGGINCAFTDGSAHEVALPELWTLKWHKSYQPRYDVVIPWLHH